MKTTKNYFSYLFLSLTLAFSSALFSCNDEDENVGSKEDLIGTWQYVYHGWSTSEDGKVINSGSDNFSSWKMKITFKKDGIATRLKYSNYSSDPKEIYEWSYKGNKLSLIPEGDEDNTETFIVKTLNSTQLILETSYKEKDEGIIYEEYDTYILDKIDN